MSTATISTIVGLLVAALELYAIVLAITRTHGVERTLAWVFAIIAMPGVGALAFLLLASPSVRRTARRKCAASEQVRCRRETEQALRASSPTVRRSPLVGSVLELVGRLTGHPAQAGNAVQLLAESDEAFEEIEQAIRRAERFVWAEYYLIRNDETGGRFLDLLAEKAEQGIDVRLLYDGVGSLNIDTKRLRQIERAGGKVEVFLPLNPLRRRWAVHLRNHRKLIIVDGEVGFTGGMNVGDEYSGRALRRGKEHFRDTHLAVRGPAVADLGDTFAEDWAFATDEELEPLTPAVSSGGDAVVAIVPSGPDQQYNANALVYFTSVGVAAERAYLTSPYFIPDGPTIRSLVTAAMRGVDVRILVPRRPDVALVRAAARWFYPRLVEAGVRIYEYMPTMLHAKTLVVDGAWVMAGSANVDIRSFRLNFELSAIVIDAALAAEMEARFLRDLEDAVEITVDSVAKYGFARRFAYGTARLLSPLL
ncbi:MAG: cardiolipin synthase [Deltaproteobacteria bacterium]|jgi:cardiolipin synthase|nr:cardiolipin synthase [Deltaproteobacteria bacterium]MBW2529838.1 cardiolipin synthase [Deltaproteobacteria bacterium]